MSDIETGRTNSNQVTLTSYEDHIQEYIDGTPQVVDGFFKIWIDGFLGRISKNSKILELGSAFGRDADYIESLGFHVRRTDATENFVKYQQAQGHAAEKLNAITDSLGGPYDLILANAVLLHFPPDDFRLCLSKIRTALRKEGIFAFTVKQGAGSGWSSEKLGAPRFFQFWNENTLRRELTKFQILDLRSDPTGKWLHVIVQ
jgi:SAM-dependent methyltransferase